ncbi:TetR/AcrR family transcriptional regulator [Phaeodactylibacter sp.]|uniref:TetR/AcrR family transcriptional regulator n=1 Tax=Phaeodactylibacter sp. TaxID=1940289 RepID=UPI0025D3CDB6|nr:TetR/AcrR family transcriptional regulator [Phaeodactylibacter sp.]MCI5091636.1 TetR family transcriptional regulator [Phaeodactylibacter sp.]
MNKTKQKILNVALDLYNRDGVSNVSIRQLAKEVGISHSNLIYHYPAQEDIILGLHDQLLRKAVEHNKKIKLDTSPLTTLYRSTKTGFSVVYDFRFLFKDLQYICSSFPKMSATIKSVERVRSEMYRSVINQMVTLKLIRPEAHEKEFDHLITLIKIFSDHWLVSSSIYDDLSKEERLEKYSYLLMCHFRPYLTKKGVKEFNSMPIMVP